MNIPEGKRFHERNLPLLFMLFVPLALVMIIGSWIPFALTFNPWTLLLPLLAAGLFFLAMRWFTQQGFLYAARLTQADWHRLHSKAMDHEDAFMEYLPWAGIIIATAIVVWCHFI